MASSRSPHGERGLKSYFAITRDDNKLSLSSWRAWIEIEIIARGISVRGGRSPHGERGLKYTQRKATTRTPCRSPHGERGLKSHAGRRPAQRRRRSPHGERGLKC